MSGITALKTHPVTQHKPPIQKQQTTVFRCLSGGRHGHITNVFIRISRLTAAHRNAIDSQRRATAYPDGPLAGSGDDDRPRQLIHVIRIGILRRPGFNTQGRIDGTLGDVHLLLAALPRGRGIRVTVIDVYRITLAIHDRCLLDNNETTQDQLAVEYITLAGDQADDIRASACGALVDFFTVGNGVKCITQGAFAREGGIFCRGDDELCSVCPGTQAKQQPRQEGSQPAIIHSVLRRDHRLAVLFLLALLNERFVIAC